MDTWGLFLRVFFLCVGKFVLMRKKNNSLTCFFPN